MDIGNNIKGAFTVVFHEPIPTHPISHTPDIDLQPSTPPSSASAPEDITNVDCERVYDDETVEQLTERDSARSNYNHFLSRQSPNGNWSWQKRQRRKKM
jgi:hypothetical protein